jgi:hypothetical protein
MGNIQLGKNSCENLNGSPIPKGKTPYQTGNIHVSAFGGLMSYYQHWPHPPKHIDLNNSEQAGKWLCDSNGIPRDGEYCKIGHFTAKFPDLYSDIEAHYLNVE